jgi:putative transposase
MGYFSVRQAAARSGTSKSVLYRRSDIQEMIQSTTPEIGSKGLKLYPLSAFPADIKILLMDATTLETHPPLRVPLQGGDLVRGGEAKISTQLSPDAAGEVSLRLEILNRRDTWVDAGKYRTQYEADVAFCKAAMAGEIPDLDLSELAWGQYKGLSRSTLCRMRQKRDKREIGGLARTVGHRKASGAIDRYESLNRFILGQILSHPQQSIDQMYKKMEGLTFPVMPSLESVRRWVKIWIQEHQSEYLSVTNPDAWRNKHQVAFGSYSEGVSRPNQLWEIDSSPTDTMLTNGRSTEVALIDVYSRRVMVKIFKTSKAEAIMTLIRLAVMEWGLPTSIKSDQGKDYCSEAVVRFCAELAIELRHCMPYSPWQKPHVERFFGTLNHAQADLPGYIGHDVATREAIRSQHSFASNRRKPDLGAGDKGTITPEQFGCWLDDWVDKYNAQTHSETGKSPNHAFAELAHPERCTDVRLLDRLMGYEGERKVGKKGILWKSYEFFEAELALHEGKQVRIYSDVLDLSRLAVYDLQQVFICEAICFELRGISRYEVARAATAKQNAAKAEFKKEAAKLKREANKLRPNVEAIQAASELAKVKPTPPVTSAPLSSTTLTERSRSETPVRLTLVTPITAAVKSEPQQRLGEVIFAQVLRAAELGRAIPTDFTDEDRRQLRVYLSFEKGYCEKRIPMAFDNDRQKILKFEELIADIANPQVKEISC